MTENFSKYKHKVESTCSPSYGSLAFRNDYHLQYLNAATENANNSKDVHSPSEFPLTVILVFVRTALNMQMRGGNASSKSSTYARAPHKATTCGRN